MDKHSNNPHDTYGKIRAIVSDAAVSEVTKAAGRSDSKTVIIVCENFTVHDSGHISL